ncbi:MAG TPA: protein-L-isoaspartate O-methyltransferase [Sphingomicrobium sp.]|nr:protein-L-isoaspartate O-methyltransferase [Sphingomicrobium sp.]
MTIHAPLPDFAAARAAMVDSQLRPQGIIYPPVVEAMSRVPREAFVAEESLALAYADRPVPIGEERMMSPPAALGLLLAELLPVPGERALVVGAGTGYSCAVLGAMGVKVIGLESSPALAERARSAGIDVAEGPLEQGWKKGAPYDLVLIDGAVEHIPDAIIDQLAANGRLGAALLDRGVCRLAVGRKAGDGFGIQTLADAGVPPLPGFAKPRTFSF